MVGLYVDDFMVCGTNKKLKWFEKIMGKFEISVVKHVDEFIGVELTWDWTEGCVVIHQHRIVKKLLTMMDKDLEGVQNHTTPAIPGVGVIRPEKDDPRAQR